MIQKRSDSWGYEFRIWGVFPDSSGNEAFGAAFFVFGLLIFMVEFGLLGSSDDLFGICCIVTFHFE